jgi:hypothetical protein
MADYEMKDKPEKSVIIIGGIPVALTVSGEGDIHLDPPPAPAFAVEDFGSISQRMDLIRAQEAAARRMAEDWRHNRTFSAPEEKKGAIVEAWVSAPPWFKGSP